MNSSIALVIAEQDAAAGPTIQTKRLLLRPMRLEDAADFHLFRSDPEVVEYTYAFILRNNPRFC